MLRAKRRNQCAVALHSRKGTLRSINPYDACDDSIWMLLDHAEQSSPSSFQNNAADKIEPTARVLRVFLLR